MGKLSTMGLNWINFDIKKKEGNFGFDVDLQMSGIGW